MLFELKKCIQKRHIICIAAFLAAWGIIIPGILTYMYWNVNLRLGYSEKASVAEAIENISSYDLKNRQKRIEISNEERELMKSSQVSEYSAQYLYESRSNKMNETEIMQDYYNYGTSTSYIRKLIENGKPRSLLSVKTAHANNPESGCYSRQLKMLETVGEPESEYTRFMQYYEKFGNISMLIIMTFIIFFFSNTGSREFSSKMNLIIYGSPRGLRKVIINKILSIMAVGCTSVLFLGISQFVIFFGAGYGANLNINLNCLSADFVYCPYDISVAGYFIFKILMQLAAVIIVSVILVLCSMQFKSSIAAIAITGMATLGGYAFSVMGFDHSVPVRYSLAGIMMPYTVVKDYYALEIGGAVIDYPVVYAVWLLLVCAFCVWRLARLKSF